MASSTWKVELDYAGIGELLRSGEMAELMQSTAGAIAAQAAGSFTDAEPVVQPYTTDRQAAGASVYGENVISEEIQGGYLKSAVASAGLAWRPRRRSA